jgi:carbonic anhydrase/acetyltransferase-like protein (isoleucine patch superfamily)
MAVLPFKGKMPVIANNVFIAPGAMVVGDVTIHEGASIWYNTVVRGDTASIVIGRRSNIQDNCTLHTDADAPLVIGEECTVGHNAIVHGATVANHVLIGMQAVILSHAQIGEGTIVGACALVSERKQIPSGVLAIGIPVKVVRELSESEREQIRESAAGYCERAAAHKQSLEE